MAAALWLAVASGAAQAANDVTVLLGAQMETLDPHDANQTLALSMVRAFYQGLYGFDAQMKVVPQLAVSHQVSADGRQYTLTLRKGVKFHDGSDFNAAAVKASFDRLLNPANRLRRQSLLQYVEQVEVVDAGTVRFKLRQPYAAFFNTLAHPGSSIVSPQALARMSPAELAQHPVGTGPFRFAGWSADEGLRAERFSGYWQRGYPKVDSLTWKLVRDNNTRTELMLRGQAQFMFPLPTQGVAFFRKKPQMEVVSVPSTLQRYVMLNTLQKPFDDVRVRAALNYAIDKEALIQTAYQGYGSAATGVMPTVMEYAVRTGPWPYNPAKARALLKEAGYPNGFETTLWSAHTHSTSQKAIEFIQQQLLQVGVRANVQTLNTGQRQRIEAHTTPQTSPVRMLYIGWSSSTGEADWAIRPLFGSLSTPPRLSNFAYYQNAAVDAALHQALSTPDNTAKAQLYAQAQRQIWKDAPAIFLASGQLLYVRSRDLSGMQVLPDGSLLFDELDRK